MLTLLLAASAFAFSPHCEITGRLAGASAPVKLEVYGMPGEKKIASGRSAKDGSFKLRFWQSKTDGFGGFVVRAPGKSSPEVKFSIDPGDCHASVDF